MSAQPPAFIFAKGVKVSFGGTIEYEFSRATQLAPRTWEQVWLFQCAVCQVGVVTKIIRTPPPCGRAWPTATMCHKHAKKHPKVDPPMKTAEEIEAHRVKLRAQRARNVMHRTATK